MTATISTNPANLFVVIR